MKNSSNVSPPDEVYALFEDVKREIAEMGRRIEEVGLNIGASGNISVRVAEDLIAITPSGLIKSKLSPKDILIINFEGDVVEGERNPSIETPMHIAIYKARKDVGAIIHCHPVYATVFAAIRKDIPVFLEEMAIYLGGEIRVAEFARTGTDELADNVVEALGVRKVALLANHGLVAVGRDLEDAYEAAVRAERVSKIYLLSLLLGGPKSIPREVIEDEIEIYKMKNELE